MRDVKRAMKELEEDVAGTDDALANIVGAPRRRSRTGIRRILGPVLDRRSIRRMIRERDFEGLAAALVSREPSLSRRAAVALCRLDDPGVVPALLGVYDAHYVGRRASELVIRHLGEKAIPSLRDAFGREYRGCLAGDALAALGEEHALDILLEALESDDPSRRKAGASGLGELDSGRPVEPLIGALRDPCAGVRELAAVGLGALRDTRAIKPLITVLERDPEPEARRAAAESLSRLGGEDAAEALWRVASREPEEVDVVRDAAIYGLRGLEGFDAPSDG